jgi:hypothetical protein
MKMRFLTDYRGRRVRLTAERLEHVREHPEMRGLEKRIAATLRAPERVIQSRSDREAELLYSLLPKPRMGIQWLCAVVKYRPDDAFLLTAYLTDKPKKGVQLWPAR